MSPKYFQGNSVKGPVRASAASSFREVVDALRVCPVLGMTRDAFLALDKAKRNEAKQVPFFVPAAFRESPSARSYQQAEVCNLIFLDLDELKDGRCPAAPFVQNPDSLYAALEGFNFAAHTTASSTKEKPRMRIVVEASDIPLDRYPQAVGTVAALLGLSGVNTESKVAVQPMFLPVLFSDTAPEDHPLIAHRTEGGRPFTEDDISASVPDTFRAPRSAENSFSGESDGVDSLDFLRAPVPEITLAIAKEAISHVDPDCAYYEWLECAAALRHQFSHNAPEEAYEIFHNWSQKGSKYAGDEDTRAKWESLRQTPNGRLPITIRTMLHHAAAAGWDDRRVKEDGFNRVVRWMEDTETLVELLEKGVRKIIATPLITPIQEGVLISQLCKSAKDKFAHSASVTEIRKELKRVKDDIRAQSQMAEKKKEPAWAKGVCYIASAQEFFRHRTGEKYKEASFDAIYSRHLLPTPDDLKAAGIPITAASLSKPVVAPSDFALNHLKIPAVYDYAYDPSQPTETFFVSRGRKFVNTYAPTYPEMDKRQAEEAGTMFQKHMGNLIAEPEYRVTMTDYLAYQVQNPGQKIRWAPLLQGAEGCGKTWVAELLKAVLGKEHVKTINGTAVLGGWNEWAFGFQVVVLEEVRVAGANRMDIMNRLKEWITNDSIPINERFRSLREVDNNTNYILFSNFHDCLALTPGDRRYFVIKSPLQRKEQVLSLGEDYFPSLFAMLRDKAGGMRAWLNEWTITPGFSPNSHAPRTKYVQELIADSANALTAAVSRLIAEGDHPLIKEDIVSAKALTEILVTDEGMPRLTAQQIASTLRAEGFQQVGRHTIGDERQYLWARGAALAMNVPEEAARRHSVGNNSDIL